MARPYRSEMAALPSTLQSVSAMDTALLKDAIARASTAPVIAVGSGGSLTAAHNFARLHRKIFGRVAVAVTPYQLRAFVPPRDSHVWLFSAGGSNVDVLDAVRTSVRAEPAGLNIVTARTQSHLARVCAEYPHIGFHPVTIPAKKDGFLATNTLLAFCAAVTRSYLETSGQADVWSRLAEYLQSCERPDLPEPQSWVSNLDLVRGRDHIVVLHGNDTSLGAVDLESKFTEAGVQNVQLADYRHFAHGRHHWLAKHEASSGIIAFSSSNEAVIAERTLGLIPEVIPKVRVHINAADGESSELASLLAAFYITGVASFANNVDPGQPGVPDYGRRLYHLALPPGQARTPAGAAMARKLDVAGLDHRALNVGRWRDYVVAAKRHLTEQSYGGVVLDYDGTVVDTLHRFQPPTARMARQISRLLETGVPIGIATGRGRSAGVDLRKVLPAELWPRVVMGYYNGGSIASLADVAAPDRTGRATADLAQVRDLLVELQHSTWPELVLTERHCQLTVQTSCGLPETTLWSRVRQVAEEAGMPHLKVFRSSHSIDVLDPAVSKLNVVRAIADVAAGRQVLRIGDRGQWPGNDFDLLASPDGLSVDEVSHDSHKCWNLNHEGVRGTRGTLYYLERLSAEGSVVRISWEDE